MPVVVGIAVLWNHANAPIYVAVPKQMRVPVGIPREGTDQFEIAQVAAIIEKEVGIITGGCYTRVRTKYGQNSGGELGQNHVP
ncbi:hypothetical protein EV424DRAFT_1460001 [Suillus variegatus]|nr:hypothetical protein EV424DRAFT_1460001 [Suillus variegatus]